MRQIDLIITYSNIVNKSGVCNKLFGL